MACFPTSVGHVRSTARRARAIRVRVQPDGHTLFPTRPPPRRHLRRGRDLAPARRARVRRILAPLLRALAPRRPLGPAARRAPAPRLGDREAHQYRHDASGEAPGRCRSRALPPPLRRARLRPGRSRSRPGRDGRASPRELLALVLPGARLAPLRRDHVVYKSFYLLDGPAGRVVAAPDLEAIELGGRVPGVFSGTRLLRALARDSFGAT